MRPQIFQLRHVDLFDIGEVWDAPLRLLHLFGDLAPQADHLDLVEPVSFRVTAGRGSGFAARRNVRIAILASGFGNGLTGSVLGFAEGAAGAEASALPAPWTSSSTSGAPTVAISPGAPWSETTTPVTGEVISTVALSVITSTRFWSSSILSPTLTCQATISASTVPSPTSGNLKM